MNSLSGCDIRLVFTFPPKDSKMQYKKCVHLWNNFPCISTLKDLKHFPVLQLLKCMFQKRFSKILFFIHPLYFLYLDTLCHPPEIVPFYICMYKLTSDAWINILKKTLIHDKFFVLDSKLVYFSKTWSAEEFIKYHTELNRIGEDKVYETLVLRLWDLVASSSDLTHTRMWK